ALSQMSLLSLHSTTCGHISSRGSVWAETFSQRSAPTCQPSFAKLRTLDRRLCFQRPCGRDAVRWTLWLALAPAPSRVSSAGQLAKQSVNFNLFRVSHVSFGWGLGGSPNSAASP